MYLSILHALPYNLPTLENNSAKSQSSFLLNIRLSSKSQLRHYRESLQTLFCECEGSLIYLKCQGMFWSSSIMIANQTSNKYTN